MTAIRHRAPAILGATLIIFLPLTAPAEPQNSKIQPDSVEMKNGNSFRGLILKNDADSVLIQMEKSEIEIPKSKIRRIHDNPDPDIAYYKITAAGELPEWRAMVMDMRENDSIHSFRQIPATTIDSGIFKNIPYLSFRVNKLAEFNVYGPPNDPVGVEFGVYGRRKNSEKFQQIIRQFIAGHLNSRKEIATLYSLSLHGGKQQVGSLVLEITPPQHADAYGGWWISIYDPKRAEAARVSDAEYAAVTRPFDQIARRNGSLRKRNVEKEKSWLAANVEKLTGAPPKSDGFYRDREGVLRIQNSNSGQNSRN